MTTPTASLPTRTRRDGEPMDAFMDRVRAIYGGPVTLVRLLERACTARPGKLALVDTVGNRWTYAEMAERVRRLIGGLAAAGIPPRASVALMMRNHADYVAAYYAVITGGWVLVPLNVRLAPRELAYILDNARVAAVLADAEFRGVLAQAERLRGQKVPVFWRGPGGDGSYERLGEAPAQPFAPAEEDDVAAIYYTSGTTGQPKGAMISHRNMAAVAQQNVEAWGFDSPDVVELEISPLFHVSFQEFGPPVHHAGGTLVVDNFSPRRALDLIEQEGINAFFAVPSMLFMMMDALRETPRDTRQVRLVKYGGAPMPVERLDAVQAMFPNALLVQGFGQTESTGMIAVTWPDEVRPYPLSTGRAISGCIIAIVDDDDRPLPPGTVGEIVARGPQIFLGYFGNPAASAETLRNGWLHTGDLGYLDEGGRLYVVDRKKDLIIRGGQNIYSAEVEAALYLHPAVAEAAVVGKPDPLYGEVVVAFVRLKPDTPATAEDLDRFMVQQIAAYKRPVAYYFVDDFPRTASGKVRKVELRERVRNETV
ncbi:MAG: AMP-binding protein [Actinomycetia bacterium]|nr:AMP-binding protein [Actinomycetes bacterium]